MKVAGNREPGVDCLVGGGTEVHSPRGGHCPVHDPIALPRRILIVDDNADAAASLALLLKISGHETQTANDGLEAVRTAETFLPDVVLLDIGLPKLNGFDACRQIRQQAWGRNMKIVALTGWGQEGDRREATEAGFDAHMLKPVDYRDLMTVLSGMGPAQ